MINYLLDAFNLRQGSEEDGASKSCLGCRLFSGAGIIGGGTYVAYYGRNRSPPYQRYLMLGVALGFIGLGLARILNLPPFPTAEIQETK